MTKRRTGISRGKDVVHPRLTRDAHLQCIRIHPKRLPRWNFERCTALWGVRIILAGHMDKRNTAAVEGIDVRQPQQADAIEARLGLPDQPCGVDAEGGREKSGELLDAVRQEQHRALLVPVQGVIEPDANLQDALVEPADRASLGVPLVLDDLMLLIEPALVE